MTGMLLVRADAGAEIGTGHVMRDLALTQEWRHAGGRAAFVLAGTTPGILRLLGDEGLDPKLITAPTGSREDAIETVRLAREQGASWVVVDGYRFGPDYQRWIRDSGLRLLLIDDNGPAGHYSADLVLNQNLYAVPAPYADREPYTRLLLGTRYVLLRRQFNAYRESHREIPASARRILVTLGGTDSGNVTGRVIAAIEQVAQAGLELVVVVGGSNPNARMLSSQIAGLTNGTAGDRSISARMISDARNMPELMAWADVAVASSGSTSWELAFMGLPSLLLVLADNQQAVADSLHKSGIARATTLKGLPADLAALLGDREGRRGMSERARQLVDGDGAGRVVASLRAGELTLRRAEAGDCRLTWEWANEPETRAASFKAGPIPWEDHMDWFRARTGSPDCLFYFALNGQGRPIGQIRYDVRGSEAIVSVMLAPEARGRGYGAPLILSGARQAFADSSVASIHAYIKPANRASLRVFERAGYACVGETDVSGQRAVHLVLKRESVP